MAMSCRGAGNLSGASMNGYNFSFLFFAEVGDGLRLIDQAADSVLRRRRIVVSGKESEGEEDERREVTEG